MPTNSSETLFKGISTTHTPAWPGTDYEWRTPAPDDPDRRCIVCFEGDEIGRALHISDAVSLETKHRQTMKLITGDS